MANKRITDVDFIDSLNSDESFFVNQNNSIKQINRGNIIVPVANGGTGATTAAGVLTNLGITATTAELNYVDGVTSNIQTQLNGKANSSHAHSISDVTNLQSVLDTKTNQNAFSNIKVGTTTIAADTTTDTLTLAGSNVTLTADVTNDKVTIAVADGTTSAKGVIKLTDSVTSTSTTTAATPKNVKAAYDLANQAKTTVDSLSNKIPQHYHNWKYCYVNSTSGNDDNDGFSESKPFKTIDKAFNLANDGWVNLRIYVSGSGTYEFSKRAFVGMAIHIENTSDGEVILKQISNGITAFYNTHINSVGISWYGYNDGSTWKDLYFEGCSTIVENAEIKPKLMTYGGNIIARNITTGGVRLSYSPAKLDGITINIIDNVNNTSNITNVGFLGVMSNIVCNSPITFNGGSIMNRVYHIDGCNMYMQTDAISGLASGATSAFYRSIIYCDKNTKTALAGICKLNSMNCIWECDSGLEELTLTKPTQSNYAINTLKAYNRSNIIDVHISVDVKTASSDWLTIATLPSGYYPPVNIYKDVPYFDITKGNANIRLRITSSGEIQLALGVPDAAYAFHDAFCI